MDREVKTVIVIGIVGIVWFIVLIHVVLEPYESCRSLKDAFQLLWEGVGCKYED